LGVCSKINACYTFVNSIRVHTTHLTARSSQVSFNGQVKPGEL